jgi:hypothetical protein
MATVTQIAQSDANILLTYSVATTPSPIQVSPQSGDPMKATLTIVANNPDGATPVYVQQLTIALTVGKDAASLVAPGTTFKAMVSSANPGWQISDPTVDGIVTITPISGGTVTVTTDGITIVLYDIIVNKTVGTTQIVISEEASTSSIGPFDPNALGVYEGKFPYAFFAGDFHATAIQVNNGGQTTLAWIGSQNATYTILWGANTQDVSSVRSWQTPKLYDTTTFYLQVSFTQQGETVVQYFSLTVAVANPSIVATTLEVLNTATMDSTLTTKGNTTLQGTLTVPAGTTTLRDAVANSMTVHGTASSSLLTSGGVQSTSYANLVNLTVTGNFTLNSPATMFTNVQSIAGNRNYYAQTDGFIIAAVQANGIDYTQSCLGWAYVNSGDVSYWCTGGNFNSLAGRTNTSNMCIAPVRRGRYCAVGYQNANGISVAPYYYFWWIPMGTGNVSTSGETLVMSDEEFVFPTELVPTSEDVRLLPQLSGSAHLHEGKATVEFAPLSADGAEKNQNYTVLVVPSDMCNGLAVVRKAEQYFIVQELHNGTSNVAFDWHIVRNA